MRIMATAGAVAALAVICPAGQAAADPEPSGSTEYAIGKCFDPAGPVVQRPTRFAYNCDNTGVMDAMTWTQWDADGARGTGTDTSIECKPNCAQGPKLVNPIAVHAWNPLPAPTAGCQEDAQFYSDMTIAYPEGAPPWIDPGTTWDTGTDFVTVDGVPAVHFSGLAPKCATPSG